MNYFDKYISATPAATGNQSFFATKNPTDINTSRIYYKIRYSGKNIFSLLFSNTVDSTFSNGAHSRKNRVISPYEIISAKAGITKLCDCNTAVEPDNFIELRFDGKSTKLVGAGEFFHTDDFTLTLDKGDYLCLELKFRGKEMPCHPECNIPTFVIQDGKFVPSINTPLPSMVGVRKENATRLAFWGDSITQGIGTPKNSYDHYAAKIADGLGENVAVWDIGIGYARADDAASGGAWMYKARQNDIIVVCFGVNDILHEGARYGAEGICERLKTIVTELKEFGLKVVIQSVPPFDYNDVNRAKWEKVNAHVVSELAPICDGYFNNVPILCKDGFPWLSKYGAHPNSVGHALWGEALGKYLKELFGL